MLRVMRGSTVYLKSIRTCPLMYVPRFVRTQYRRQKDNNYKPLVINMSGVMSMCNVLYANPELDRKRLKRYVIA